MAVTIGLVDYKRKNIPAYACKISILDGRIVRGQFAEVVPEKGESQKFYAGKSCDCTVSLEDGLWEYQEANGHKTDRGYLLIQSDEIIDQWGTVDELLTAHLLGRYALPSLEGSAKQVDWAESLRTKALLSADLSQEQVANLSTDAHWWIENRENLKVLLSK